MKRRFQHILDRRSAEQLPDLICLSVCFAVGVILGCCFVGYLGEDAQTHLSAYLNGYFTVLRDGEIILPSLFSTVWELCRWPVLVFLLGFTALGVFAIPVVLCVRGFLLSFSVAVFIRLFGGVGALAALCVFGVSVFLTVPVLFLLGLSAFGTAKTLTSAFWGDGKRVNPFHTSYFARAGGCGVLLAVGVALQTWLAPALLQAVAGLVS